MLSGVAGIVNQVLWQRALKIFLGGSETLSAMIVVLVFLTGLGVGAAAAGRWAQRVPNPLAALAGVELGLALLNAGVALLLGLDISESVYAAQRVAVGAGVPLRLVYGVGATVVLALPTILMGATIPLASAGCQRQLGAESSRLVPALFFVNTAGAAMGALGASFWLLPWLGQRKALLCAVAFNAVAAVAIGVLARRPRAPATAVAPSARVAGLTREEWFGGALGFLALAYEMALFRALSLAHEPLPTTFATGLCGFLLAWSLGVALAGRRALPVAPVAWITAVLVALLLPVHAWIRDTAALSVGLATVLYTLPCVGFGALYGALVARGAKDWGRDVGRYAAVNTIGSALGVLLFTLLGFELPQTHGVGLIAIGFGVVGLLATQRLRWAALPAGLMAAVLLLHGVTLPYTEDDGVRAYWGRDGVVEIDVGGDVWIDGLWHTKLTDGEDHIGRPYSWMMAAAAVLAHRDVPLERALVIGAGVGVSSVSLAGVEGLQVDGYEINHTLKPVLRDYPLETLDALNQDNMRWFWQDARTGLALNPTRYQIILSAPLHLKQAGSSLLLSREYLALVKSRLEPDGVVAVYSNEGEGQQALLVQRTLAELFRYRVTWYDGIVTVASDHPISLDRFDLDERMTRPDRLYQEMAWLDRSLREDGGGGLWSWYEADARTGVVADRPITDDHPLVEYPELAGQVVDPVLVETLTRD